LRGKPDKIGEMSEQEAPTDKQQPDSSSHKEVKIGGQKVKGSGRTLDVVEKLKRGDIDQTSSQDVDAARRAAIAALKIKEDAKKKG
jgi:hypothetical protein